MDVVKQVLRPEIFLGKKITFTYTKDGMVRARYSTFGSNKKDAVYGKTKKSAFDMAKKGIKDSMRYRQTGEQTKRGLTQDRKIKAKRPGRRVSKTGYIYYERRRNRSDKYPNENY